MLDHLFTFNGPNGKTVLKNRGWTIGLICNQDRENFYFTGKSRLEDLGTDYRSLCIKANKLNKLDAQWGIHHWVAKL